MPCNSQAEQVAAAASAAAAGSKVRNDDMVGDVWLSLAGGVCCASLPLFPPAAVRRCGLTVSKPVLKAPMVSALETMKQMYCFQLLLSNLTCATTPRRRSPPSPAGAYTHPHFSSTSALLSTV
jgi:hypothetical protein